MVGATSHVVDELVDHGRVLGQCVVSVDWQRDSLDVCGKHVFFNPPLGFDPADLAEEYWQSLV